MYPKYCKEYADAPFSGCCQKYADLNIEQQALSTAFFHCCNMSFRRRRKDKIIAYKIKKIDCKDLHLIQKFQI